MLFIYLLEGKEELSTRVRDLLQQSRERGDLLITSHLALGELLTGARKFGGERHASIVDETVREMGFTFLSFDASAVATFSKLRADHRVKTADAIHLSCAAAAGVDLFLTGDKDLLKLYVPGIHFIAGFDTPLL